jgi:hypothetical protein
MVSMVGSWFGACAQCVQVFCCWRSEVDRRMRPRLKLCAGEKRGADLRQVF